jgi:hypothetical protein
MSLVAALLLAARLAPADKRQAAALDALT